MTLSVRVPAQGLAPPAHWTWSTTCRAALTTLKPHPSWGPTVSADRITGTGIFPRLVQVLPAIFAILADTMCAHF